MNAFERREAIIDRMKVRKFDTVYNLSAEFGVCRRTLLTDIQELVCSGYPIQANMGRGGGIHWNGSKRQFPFSDTELTALNNALAVVSAEDRVVITKLLRDKSKPEVTVKPNDLFDLLRDGISQAELARRLEVTKSLITMVLSGQRKPSAELAARIEKYKQEVLGNEGI
jgi:transcriptional antiterminator